MSEFEDKIGRPQRVQIVLTFAKRGYLGIWIRLIRRLASDLIKLIDELAEKRLF